MTTKTSKRDRRGQSQSLFDSPGKQRGGGKKQKGTGNAKGPRKGRKVAKVKVGTDRNWGVLLTFVVVGVIAAGLIVYSFVAQRGSAQETWQERANAIEGIHNYRESNPEMLTNQHVTGTQQYEVTPPVGGNHNGAWQNCQGNVYTEPIHNEHAVHSLEHGAIWITYNPDLVDQSQIDQLASLVEGNEKMLMSPYPDMDIPISLQAWGYQLRVSDPGDPRINEFIRALRINASLEGPSARCDSGVLTGQSDPSTLQYGDQMGG
ncbi:MAG TPA: DUF3105 domain-containing protein [Natronosporangium sp.]